MADNTQNTPPRAKHGRKPPPENETSHERFLRLGQPRMRNALHAIRLIGNLSQDAYQWEQADLDLMKGTLTQAVNLTMSRFEKERPPKLENTFTFVSEEQ